MIEAMVTLCLMLMVMVVFGIMGSGYYNKVILNSTAQNMSLASQSIMDRDCVPGFSAANCHQAEFSALAARNRIWNQAQRNLIGVTWASSSGTVVSRSGLNTAPGTNPIPGTGGIDLGPGWGWTRVQLRVRFTPVLISDRWFPVVSAPGCPPVAICQEARSLTVSYQEPVP